MQRNILHSCESTATTTADNATATVSSGAPPSGQSNFITHLSGSFSVAQTTGKLMQLLDGATVKWQGHVFNDRDVIFTNPVKIHGNAQLNLAASGTAGQIGAVSLGWYTR